MNKLLKELLKIGVINGETVVLDATFVKAYSRRDPRDNSRGKSDPEARVGRNGKTYELGYKLHIAIDAKSELPSQSSLHQPTTTRRNTLPSFSARP